MKERIASKTGHMSNSDKMCIRDRDKGFVPGQYSEENYDKIDLHRPYVDDVILVSKASKNILQKMRFHL